MSSPATRLPLLAATLAGSLLLAGCAAFSDDSATENGAPRVATAFYPLQYVAQRVAGDLATVENLTQPGAEPHDLELTIAQTAEVAEADLVVHEEGFQPAVDDAVEQNATGEVLDAAEVVHLEELGHEGEDHGTEGHEEHDHGDLDPHFWQDPLRMAALGDAVAERLGQVDPDHADDYTANAQELRADLEDLDRAYTDGLADCQRSTVVVSHDAFGYLSKYGLTMAPIAGLSPEAEPTPSDLSRLHALIETDGITTVFSERLAPPELSQTLAKDAGVRTAVLDPVEGLSDETTDEDYLSLMKQNLSALRLANGCP
jgi:zinc transport system substrate-binding protein